MLTYKINVSEFKIHKIKYPQNMKYVNFYLFLCYSCHTYPYGEAFCHGLFLYPFMPKFGMLRLLYIYSQSIVITCRPTLPIGSEMTGLVRAINMYDTLIMICLPFLYLPRTRDCLAVQSSMHLLYLFLV